MFSYIDSKLWFYHFLRTDFEKGEILEMIKISLLKKYNDCYISLYYNITIVIFKVFDFRN